MEAVRRQLYVTFSSVGGLERNAGKSSIKNSDWEPLELYRIRIKKISRDIKNYGFVSKTTRKWVIWDEEPKREEYEVHWFFSPNISLVSKEVSLEKQLEKKIQSK